MRIRILVGVRVNTKRQGESGGGDAKESDYQDDLALSRQGG
jgi:hypothetical protein